MHLTLDGDDLSTAIPDVANDVKVGDDRRCPVARFDGEAAAQFVAGDDRHDGGQDALRLDNFLYS